MDKISKGDWTELTNDRQKFQSHFVDEGIACVANGCDSADEFHKTVSKFTLSFATDAQRREERFGISRIRDVDSGNDEMPLHSESSFTPNCPEAIWFYCVNAPSIATESTTICDGKVVWEALSKQTKKFFLSNLISYELSVDLGRKMTDREWFINRLGCGEARISSGKLNFVSKRFAVNELFDSMGRPYIAFANHLFAHLSKENQILSRTVDGSNIPEDIIQECDSVCKQKTQDVTWESGDILYLNNKRFLHGRRSISPGSKRDIVISQSEKVIF